MFGKLRDYLTTRLILFSGGPTLTRQGQFTVKDNGKAYVYYSGAEQELGAGGGGGGAPTTAQYLTLALDGTLSAERRFVPTLPLSAADGGANGDYTLSLSGWSGTTDGDMLYRNGTAVGSKTPAQARTWLDLATYYQPLDAELSAIAGLTSAADKLPYFTGSGTAAVTTFTSFARTLLDDADATAGRSTLDAEQKVRLTDGAAVTRTVATLRDGEFLKVSGGSIISAAVNVAAFIALTDGFDQDPDEDAFLTPIAIFMSDGSDA